MSSLALALIPALAGIIGAIGTILIARWTQQGQQKVFLTEKVDEIVDERVAELRADRDAVRAELRVGEEERQRLFEGQFKLREANAILKSKITEIQLHREQAINRMRRELSAFQDKNTALFAKNAEMEAQIQFLQQENQKLRQQIHDVQQQ